MEKEFVKKDQSSLKNDLDALLIKHKKGLGKKDYLYIKKVANISLFLEFSGRVLIFLSFEWFSLFFLGVILLWVHKQLETIELGHNIQHLVYENIPEAEEFHLKNYWWRFHLRTPIHAPSWRYSHNHLHHGYTNVVGKDPDARLYLREKSEKKHKWYHPLLFLEIVFNWPNILFNANAMATGLFDVYTRSEKKLEVLPDKSWKSIKQAHQKAFYGCVLYFLREYILFPLLAGPAFMTVLAGNFLSSLMRNLFTAPALYAGHISPEVDTYGKSFQVKSKEEWYEMQIRSTQNFEVPLLVSILVGGLDRQIEHHLFPKLPPNRLRKISLELKRICQKHGLPYHSKSWGRTVLLTFKKLYQLSFSNA